VQLYEDCAKSQAKRKVEDSLVEEGGEREEGRSTTHVFQVHMHEGLCYSVVVSHVVCFCVDGCSMYASLIPRPLMWPGNESTRVYV